MCLCVVEWVAWAQEEEMRQKQEESKHMREEIQEI